MERGRTSKECSNELHEIWQLESTPPFSGLPRSLVSTRTRGWCARIMAREGGLVLPRKISCAEWDVPDADVESSATEANKVEEMNIGVV